jgi:hypothetical protein
MLRWVEVQDKVTASHKATDVQVCQEGILVCMVSCSQNHRRAHTAVEHSHLSRTGTPGMANFLVLYVVTGVLVDKSRQRTALQPSH